MCSLLLKKDRIAAFALLRILWGLPAMSSTSLSPPLDPTPEYLLEITINGVKDSEFISVYIKNENQLFLPFSFFTRHHVILPTDSNFITDPEHTDYFCLSTIPWIQSTLDLTQQKLNLMLPPDKFKERQLTAPPPSLSFPLPKDKGFYLNYDASLQHTKETSGTNLGTLNEAVYFNPYGVGSFSHLANTAFSQQYNTPFVRLETNWTINKPQEQATWRLGDAVSRAGEWGGSVRFGGFQWSTNFGIQPNFISYPLPSVKGQASLPSTVDIFVNDTLKQSHQVDHGSFGLNELPVITGQGQVSLVTQDILGRRQEIVIPYYVNTDLLKPELSDFSFEGGIIRENYGLKNFTYGKPVGVATYRQGITDYWTSGGHSEVTSSFQNVGLTNQVKVVDWAVLSHSFAVSKTATQKSGLLHAVGVSRQGSVLGFGGRAEITQGTFLRLGNTLSQPTPWLTLQTYASLSLDDQGSVSLSYAERRQKQTALFRYVTANYQRNIARDIFLTLSMSTTFKGRLEQQVGVYLNWMLDDRTSLSSTTQLRRQQSSQALSIQKSLPTDTGWGYRLQSSGGAQRHFEVTLEEQKEYTNLKLRASRDLNANNVEFNARGSVIRFGGATFFARSLTDSFGLVQVPNLKEIPVYSNNQPIGKTDAQGNLIIPHLMNYQQNKIHVNPKDLPLTTSLATETIYITPPSRSGVIAAFPFETKKIITFKLKDVLGCDCMPGTVLEDQATGETHHVGLDGEVCLQTSNPKPDIHFKVHTPNPCQARIKIPESAPEVHTLEDQQCYHHSINP